MEKKIDPRHENDGIINRDGITQGSGYGDTQRKTLDAEATPKSEDTDRTRIGDDETRRLDVDKPKS